MILCYWCSTLKSVNWSHVTLLKSIVIYSNRCKRAINRWVYTTVHYCQDCICNVTMNYYVMLTVPEFVTHIFLSKVVCTHPSRCWHGHSLVPGAIIDWPAKDLPYSLLSDSIIDWPVKDLPYRFQYILVSIRHEYYGANKITTEKYCSGIIVIVQRYSCRCG